MTDLINPNTQNIQDTEQKLPVQTTKSTPSLNIFSTILVSLIIGCAASFSTWLFFSTTYQKDQKTSQTQINQLKEQISKLESQQNTAQTEYKNPFVNLPAELQQKDTSTSVIPTSKHMVVNSILSNKKDKIVYSEIADCIGLINDDDNSNDNECDWKYGIYVKDLSTGNTKKIYAYPEEKLSLSDYLIPKVNAGGCALVYLPIGWSKNDKKIILQSVNPTNCGSGGGTISFTFASINPTGGQTEGISRGSAKFYDNFSKAIILGESQKSPQICGPSDQRNNGKILLMNTETGEDIKVVEENNSDYTLGEINPEQTQIEYIRRPSSTQDGCALIDLSSQGESKTITLP